MKSKINNLIIAKKEFTSISRPDFVKVSHDFKNDYFNYVENPELLEIPIITYRIIFKILSDLRNNTFNSSGNKLNEIQLGLFEEEFKTQDNTYARFSYKISDIDKNRNYKQIEEALKFLVSYKSAFYEHKNAKGHKIKSFGGLVTEPSYTRGTVSFLISSYWMEKLIKLDYYNNLLLNVVDSFKEPKHVLFYMWLLQMPENGTKVNFTTLTERFALNYKTARDFQKDFLYPFRKKLNAVSNESFNCSVVGNKISFVRYKLVPTDNLEENTVSKLLVKQKVSYFKVRHGLEEKELIGLKALLINKKDFALVENAYKTFVKSCRALKKKSTDYKGIEFIEEFHKILVEERK